MTAIVLRGDAARLPLPDASVDLIVTSPPYYGLRSYTDGGEHYAGQIGSEATPAEYVAALIACTREWVRVLKPSGSLFVNLGDSYASQPAGRPGANGQVNGSNPKQAHAARRGERQRRPNGGRQFTREDAAWLAGVVDSDGSVSIHVNKQPEGRAPSFVPWVRVGQMRPEVIHRIAELVGTGQVMEDGRGVWNWSASAQQARWVLERIHPWLLIKKRQAWAAIEVARHVEERNAKGTWRQLTADDVGYRHRLRDAVLAWNKGEPDDLAPPEPRPVALPLYPYAPRAKSLYDIPHQYALACVGELGLILRAEIIWAKPNGLPESVTDRVRRSHEQWFHLVKQPRYYAAVDEIREPHTGGAHARGNNASVQVWTSGEGIRHRTAHGNPEDFNPLGKLPGSVWTIPSQPLTVPPELGVDHFAAFPMEWPRRIVLGWSPPGICTACGEGRRPVTQAYRTIDGEPVQALGAWKRGRGEVAGIGNYRFGTDRQHLGYACACPSPDAPARPAVVLDPFGGTGTTALLAAVLGRTGITIDRSWDYTRLARWRTTDPGQRAQALQVPKPPVQVDGQLDMFGEAAL